MFCNKCGNQLNDGAKFCPMCGAPTGSENNNNNQNHAENNTENNTAPAVSNETIENNKAKESGAPNKKKKGAKAVILPIAIILVILILIMRLASCAKKTSEQTSGNQTQEAASVSEEAPIQLDMPVITDWILDGKVLKLYLSEIANAIEYEVAVDDQNPVSISNNWMEVFVEEGEEINLQIRAVGEPEKTIPSEWNSCILNGPLRDYENMGNMYVPLLSFDQLEKWAVTQGYEYSISEDEETTTLIIHFKDKENTGALKGAERAVAGLFDGAFDGAEEELNAEAILPSAVEKYINNGSLKDTVKEQAKDTTSAIGWSAIKKGFNYMFMDTDVYCIYIFDNNNLNKSASLGMISYLKTYNENPNTSFDEQFNKFESDGEDVYYFFSEADNRNIYISVGEDDTYEWCPRWVIYLMPE